MHTIRGSQTCSWRVAFLQTSVPTLLQHTCWSPEHHDCVWLVLELNSNGWQPFRNRVGYPCIRWWRDCGWSTDCNRHSVETNGATVDIEKWRQSCWRSPQWECFLWIPEYTIDLCVIETSSTRGIIVCFGKGWLTWPNYGLGASGCTNYIIQEPRETSENMKVITWIVTFHWVLKV